eukprot:scaffold128324_cov27-Phaeocystis_antarctica.AAC.1
MSGPPTPKGRLSGPMVDVASSSTRGSGCAPSGPVSPQGAPSQPELSGAPRAGAGADLGHCQGGTLTMLVGRGGGSGRAGDRRARPAAAPPGTRASVST